jgi:hypothetical protein
MSINILRRSFEDLKRIIPFNARTLCSHVFTNTRKLARSLQQTAFLCKCRRFKMIPPFIEHSFSSNSLPTSQRIAKHVAIFQVKLLSDCISSGYARINFLTRIIDQHLKKLTNQLDNSLMDWISSKCHMIRTNETNEMRSHLEQKFNKLKISKNTTVEESEFVTTTPNVVNRVKILTSKQLPPASDSLLSKGPNFALTNKVSDRTLVHAECAVERMIYQLRWKDVRDRHTYSSDVESPVDNQDGQASTSSVSTDVNQENISAPSIVDDPKLMIPKSFKKFAKVPPSMSIERERNVCHLKADVLNAFRKLHNQPVRSNITLEERKALQILRRDDSIIVKPSDKSKGFVVLDKNDYVDKLNQFVLADGQFTKVTKDPTKHDEAKVKRILADLKETIPEYISAAITPSHSRCAELYALIKDHKPDNPARPISSTCGTPCEGISWLVDRILSQLLPFIPTYVRNSYDFLENLKSAFPNGYPEGTILFSLDVVSLYNNIPINEGIDACIEFLSEHSSEVNTFGLSTSDVETLLKFILNNNNCRFGYEIYHQELGIAMGNRLAPALAIIFMHVFESKAVNSYHLKPNFLVRYVDDYFGIWTHGHQELLNFSTYLNNIHPTIKFTVEHSYDNGYLPFLDISLSIRNGELQHELFIKPTHSGICLNFNSSHPISVKRGLVHSQLLRARRLSSSPATFESGQKKIADILRNNDYPTDLRSLSRRQYSGRSYVENADAILRLPFISDDLSFKIRKILRKSEFNVNLVEYTSSTLRSLLVRSALERPRCPAEGTRHICRACKAGLIHECTVKNVVYRLDCKLCDQFYIGETGRPARERVREHANAALAVHQTPVAQRSSHSESPWFIHFSKNHPQWAPSSNEDSPFTAKIICRSRDVADRKISEAIFINNLQPSINIYRSWQLV